MILAINYLPLHSYSDYAYHPESSKSAIHSSNWSKILNRDLKYLLYKLDALFEENSFNGWDGYDAVPIQIGSYNYSKQFILAMPDSLSIPSLGADPDGEITFEWYRSSDKIFSISISSDGFLNYAYLNGLSKEYGTEPFSGFLPQKCNDLINKIFRK